MFYILCLNLYFNLNNIRKKQIKFCFFFVLLNKRYFYKILNFIFYFILYYYVEGIEVRRYF